MAVTLNDVARATGVSISTVSRALNEDPRISESTRVRVVEAFEALGYRGTGKSTTARTHNIAFLIADPIGSVHEDLFFSEVLRGVTDYLAPRGYHALVSPHTGQLESSGEPPTVVHRVDGMIAGGVSMKSSMVRTLIEGPVPTVFIGRYLRGRHLNSILPDNEEGARLATKHLLELGRKRVAFIGGPAKTNIYRDRLAGFRQAFEEADRVPDERLVRGTQRTAQGGIETTFKLLDEVTSLDLVPDAIFAADDWVAVGVLRALQQRGYQVPDDVAVVGYSDIALAPITDPPLTTVHVPKRRLGRVSAKLLLDLINSEIEGPIQMIVSPHLIVRNSTSTQGANTTADST